MHTHTHTGNSVVFLVFFDTLGYLYAVSSISTVLS